MISNEATVQAFFDNSDPHHKRAGATNLYFEGDTLYSYGSHYPLVIRLRDNEGIPCGYAMSVGDYSKSTQRHASIVRSCFLGRISMTYNDLDQYAMQQLDQKNGTVARSALFDIIVKGYEANLFELKQNIEQRSRSSYELGRLFDMWEYYTFQRTRALNGDNGSNETDGAYLSAAETFPKLWQKQLEHEAKVEKQRQIRAKVKEMKDL